MVNLCEILENHRIIPQDVAVGVPVQFLENSTRAQLGNPAMEFHCTVAFYNCAQEDKHRTAKTNSMSSVHLATIRYVSILMS